VTFTKVYDQLEPESVVILYEGTIQPGGDEIEGRWQRADMWSGTFLMVRQAGKGEEADVDVEAQVPV